MRYNIDQVINQKGWIISIARSNSNIGVVIGIGITNQSEYRYSVKMKYKNRIKTVEKEEIKIPKEALKMICKRPNPNFPFLRY